jgi:hypothetical protein
MNIYKSLIDNNLMEEFLMNFKVTRKVQEMNKVGIPGSSYYMDGTDKIPLQVYRYQYYVENIYSIFGHDFVSKKIIYGESVNEDDIPFKKSGKFKTEYSNLTGYETASYFADGRKNIMCKYGKSGLLDLPCNLKDLFKDRDFCLYLYLFYSYIQDRNNISIDTIFDIKRLVQITKEINKLKKERDELLESFEKVLVL